MKRIFFMLSLMLAHVLPSLADVNPNFYIYLCFGQSNMEGNAEAEAMDKSNVDTRFRMLATTDFSSPSRTMGQWYTAVPPIVSPVGKLGMADYFGRTMVAALPSEVKVGVVNVAIGGCAIEMFDKDKYQTQMTDPGNWSTILANNYYGGNPYKRLIDMAKKAQESGVIKGILLHQGESNNTQQTWPNEVKKIYNDILTDLGLSADTVPLFAGETLREEYGGACWGHNSVINRLPSVIPTAHVIHSNDCEGNGTDPWHFCAMGYRIMGKRYAYEALKCLGVPAVATSGYNIPLAQKKFYTLKKMDVSDKIMKCGNGEPYPIKGTFVDGHTEEISPDCEFVSTGLTFSNGLLVAKEETSSSVDISYTDFTGKTETSTVNLDVRFFPFNSDNITALAGSLTYDEEARTFTQEKNGQAGWVYENGVDISAYKYLVLKLKEQLNFGTFVRIYPKNDISGGYYSTAIRSRTTVGIPLQNLKYTENGSSKALDLTNIHIIALWSNGGTIPVEDMYLTNNSDFTPTDVSDILDQGIKDEDIYSIQGIKAGTSRDWQNLPRGLYIVNGRLMLKR